MHQKLTLAAVAVAAALAGVIVASMLSNSDAPTVQSGTILNQPRPIPAFSLRAHDGSDFANADLQGRWSMIFVGFTRCP
ncbi:MAG: SCO family protein, partial [Panacagrimonas sp.]